MKPRKKKEKPINVHIGAPIDYGNCYRKKCSECGTDIYFTDKLKVKIDKYLCMTCAVKSAKETDPKFVIAKETMEKLLSLGLTKEEIDETYEKIKEYIKNPDKDKLFVAS